MAPHAESPPRSLNGHEAGQMNSATMAVDGASSPTTWNSKTFNAPSMLQPTPVDEVHDIVSIGFGPAALAIAIALNDSLEFGELSRTPKVAFLERQHQFGWHSGMQIPGATMQISWIKDLATIRNPRSRFTFLNYLHAKQRLLPFSNLGTFLPKRREYEDYMRWCSEAFDDVVSYSQEALEIIPECSGRGSGRFDLFTIKSRNLRTGEVEVRRARNVIVAGGGKPKIPSNLPQHHPSVIHSASYMQSISNVLPDKEHPYRVAVLGAGQSAAETFNDLQSRYPNSHTRLIIRGSALKPSDDSPFINGIFDPQRTDGIYNAAPEVRQGDIQSAKDTNYSVVRLSLLEHMYDNLYEQRLDHDREEDFPHHILNFRTVQGIETSKDMKAPLTLHMRNGNPLHTGTGPAQDEQLEVDAVIVATGYERNLHDELLKNNADTLKPKTNGNQSSGGWGVSRNYRVQFGEGTVAPDAGVWLQGCCENTHGLSDTLLSVLATRSGEVVQSIFGSHMSTSTLDGASLDSPDRRRDHGKVNGYTNGHA